MNSILDKISKEVILVVAIVVVIYLILDNSGKSTSKSALNNVDSEAPMTENYTEDDLFNAPSVIQEDIFPTMIAEPVVKEETEGDLADFYNDNLKGIDAEYKVSGSVAGLPTNNYTDNYTLGVNVDDVEFKNLGGVPDTNKLISDDLLPKKSEDWFETPNVGTSVEDANLLADALFRGGINTVGTTNKNANYDIRGNVPNPKIVVSPWNNSSYDPDNNMQGLCA
jgi:hypothetical protein